MFDFLCCCKETSTHNNQSQYEEEIEENKNLVKMFSQSNKYVKSAHYRLNNESSPMIELVETDEGIEKSKNAVKIFSYSNKQLETRANRIEARSQLVNEMNKMEEVVAMKQRTLLNDSWLIRSTESNIEFSKKGLINHYKSLEQTDGLEKFYEKNNLLLFYTKSGSTSHVSLGKSFYKMSKKEIYTSKEGKFYDLKDEDKIKLNDIKNFVIYINFMLILI